MLRVQLFGSGRIFDHAAEIKLPSRTWTLPLLAFLLVHRGELIPRSRLAFTLWPDEPEETALLNLRRNLHRLVKALPPVAGAQWVTLDGHSIAWNASVRFDLDVAEFERLRAEQATLEQAVALYAGDFLNEIDEDWVAAERERLRQLYLADLGSLIVAKRSRRAFAAAAQYAQQLLAADPWHEDALRQLMAVRYDSGDSAGALAAFDGFSRHLRAEMNVDPMPETLVLRDAVARGVAIPSALGESEFASKRTPDPSPFVGRSEELERLRNQWLRAARGNGSLAFVRGVAGIGKSRLVSELALITEAEGGRVIVARVLGADRVHRDATGRDAGRIPETSHVPVHLEVRLQEREIDPEGRVALRLARRRRRRREADESPLVGRPAGWRSRRIRGRRRAHWRG